MKDWITPNDIAMWTDKEGKQAQQELPQLVERLVCASGQSIEEIHFPYGDATQYAGFDGFLRTAAGNQFVPQGQSVWEMGTNRYPHSKFNEDYEKRRAGHHGLNQREMTFCFVTSRIWNGNVDAGTVTTEKKQEGTWKDVRIYDAGNLALWLNQCPAVMAWFAELIGKPVDGLRDAEEYWQEYAKDTSPQLKPVYLTSGRTSLWKSILEKQNAGKSMVVVIGENRLEVLLTLAAELQLNAPEGIDSSKWEKLRRQCLFVDNDNALARCRDSRFQIRVPTYLYPDISRQEDFCIILALGRNDPLAQKYADQNHVVQLPWRRQFECIRALMEMGLGAEPAIRLAGEMHGDFPALLRKLTKNPAKQLPSWIREDHTQYLLPLLLTGAWEGDCEGDRTVIADLAGMPYDAYIRNLQKFSHKEDKPVFKVENFYTGIVLSELWKLLWNQIPGDQWNRWAQCAHQVLSGTAQPAVSKTLRKGMASSLAWVSAGNAGADQKHMTEQIVRAVLDQLETGAQWARMADVLEILAEAAPGPCLKKVQKCMKEETSPLWQIDGAVLLRMLDTWLWVREYARPALDLLLLLSETHPERRIREQACQHLARVFWLWAPQGAFTGDERVALLCQIIAVHLDLGRQLVQSAVIRWTAPAEISQPRWLRISSMRGFCDEQAVAQARREVIQAYLKTIRPMAADWDIFFPGRPSNVLSADILNRLRDQIPRMPDEERLKLGRTIAYDLSWQRQYPEAPFHIDENLQNQIEAVLAVLLPDTPARFIHCFDKGYRGIHPASIMRAGTPPQKFLRAMADFHAAQLIAMIRRYGEDALYEIAPYVEDIGAFAEAVLDVVPDSMDPKRLLRMKEADQECAAALMTRIYRAQGLQTCLAVMRALPTEEKREMLKNLPLDEGIVHWVRTEASREEEDFFWEQVSLQNFFVQAPVCIESCLPDLLNHRRAADLIRYQSLMAVRDGRLAARILQAFLEDYPGDDAAIEKLPQEAIEDLFDMIYGTQQISMLQLAQLEWAYFPARSRLSPPRGLQQMLRCSPAFYMRLLAGVYDTEAEYSMTDESERAIRRITVLLLHCRQCPGEQPEGGVEAGQLQHWIATADKLAGQWGYQEIWRSCLGRLLACAPAGTDGLWPAEPVRDWLEEKADAAVIRAMVMERRCRRGAYWDSAGQEEKKLAEKHGAAADQLCIRWPQTAEMLRMIAADYWEDAASAERLARKHS